MYALKNRVQLIGCLEKKPEITILGSGAKKARFKIITSETYRNNRGEKIKEIQLHNLVALGRLAEIAEKYLEKGTELAIEGRLVNRYYNDREGHSHYITEIRVTELLLLGANKPEEPDDI